MWELSTDDDTAVALTHMPGNWRCAKIHSSNNQQQSTLNTIAKGFAGFRNAALESTGRFALDSALFVAGLGNFIFVFSTAHFFIGQVAGRFNLFSSP